MCEANGTYLLYLYPLLNALIARLWMVINEVETKEQKSIKKAVTTEEAKLQQTSVQMEACNKSRELDRTGGLQYSTFLEDACFPQFVCFSL